MPRLEMHFLGSPRVELDGVPIEVDTRKATALLVYLAVTGESHSREALAALFWPDYDESHARAALRRTLSALNKALGGAWLNVEREAVGLNRGPDLYLDVEHFHRLLAECLTHGHPTTEACSNCLSPLDQAAALYRGDFLSGFTLRDSPAFDDWQFFQAESLRRELSDALERLTQAQSQNGRIDRAIDSARRWLALDPLHEPAHRQLMQLYAASGQRAAALRQYRECVKVLDQELGVPALEETTRLYEAIKKGSIGVATPGGRGDISPALPRPRAPAYPLVGRATEWAALLKAYASVGANGQVLALEGEAGIGKTRLAEALVDYARAAGAATIAGRCYEGESNLAYSPFVEALRAALAEPDRDRWLNAIAPHVLSEAARLAPELASQSPGLPPAPPLDSPGAQAHFFDAICQMLLASCEPPPSLKMRLGPAGLIFFDDAHWADEASLDLLAYLARRLRGRRLCILLAWRSEQIPVGHRLRHLLADAARASAGTIVSLSRLSQSAVTELVQSALRSTPAAAPLVNSPSPERLAETLYRETEGLPFFVVEYLTVIGQGAPKAVGEDWSLPGSVRDLLHSRVAPVGEITKRQASPGGGSCIGESQRRSSRAAGVDCAPAWTRAPPRPPRSRTITIWPVKRRKPPTISNWPAIKRARCMRTPTPWPTSAWRWR
ncbi:MAG: AAA family ATPase [Chloroflexi bacterium]|nr:AAA family ATPase [Chloroflexota bacterium]